MIEFNTTILQSLILGGYKNLIYHSKGDHGILQPTKIKVPEELLMVMGAYQLDITETEVIEMANGVDEFRFFVIDGLNNDQINDN